VAECVVYKGEDGKLAGFGDKGGRAWLRFIKAARQLAQGETLHFTWFLPRSPGLHKRFFQKLAYLFDMQEQFQDADRLRAWLTVGAGECDLVPGPTGKMVALPKSIKWHKLDETEFAELCRKIDDFLWSDYAQMFLWPHLSPQARYESIERLELQFR